MTIGVATPTFNGVVVEEGAGVLEACCDCGCGASGAEVDGVTGCVGAGVCSVAEVAIGVATPAFDGVVVEDRAGVSGAGGDCFGGASGAEVDGVTWCFGVGVCFVAELTVNVVSPAFDGVVVEEGAGVNRSGADGGSGASGAEVDGVTWFVGVDVCSVAELTIGVATPAFDGVVVEEGAGVNRSGADGGSGASGAEVDGVTWFVGVDVCSVAELTIGVATPAFDGVVIEDRAGVNRSGGDCFGGASGAEVDGCAWCVGVGVCSVAEFTIVVETPAFDGVVVKDCARVGSPNSQTNGFACD